MLYIFFVITIDNLRIQTNCGHLEMVGSICHQLTKGCSPQELEAAGLGDYYTDHGVCWEYPQNRI